MHWSYLCTGIFKDGRDTGIAPFAASFPELLDIGIMGHCIHGQAGLCIKAGIEFYQGGLHKKNNNIHNFTSSGYGMTEEIAKRYLKGLKEKEIDTLILGCTHYPLLRSLIGGVMGDAVQLMNPAYETALGLRRLLTEKRLLSEDAACAEGKYEFFVSDGAEKFRIFANSILPYEIQTTQIVDIEKY